MSHLIYNRMLCENDVDIPQLISYFQMPKISQYYSIDSKNYFPYVTNAANVYFYKVYDKTELIGIIHLEKQESTLFMSIVVFPQFQRTGMGTKIVEDLQSDVLGLNYDCIEVSIDEKNAASLGLFEKLGFLAVSRDDELLNYIYKLNQHSSF